MIGSEAYLPAATVIPILCVATLLFALYGIFASGVQIKGRTEFMAFTTAGGLALNVVLNVLMIPRWGMVGAATASVFANIAMCACALWISGRFYRIPFSAVRTGGTILLGIVLFGLSLWAEKLPHLGWVLMAKAGAVAALPVLVMFGFFSSEERGKVKGLVRDLYRRGAQSG